MNKDKINNDMIKSWEWFIEHGYTDPKEMIDHNENLDLPEAFMQIFVAYNQHNIAEGKAWDTWPKWELSSTSIKQDFHCAYDQEFDSEVTKTVRQHWFAAMEFMHAHQEISFDGYTIIIKGQHGNTFSFDFALGNETWGKPGTYAAQKVILGHECKKTEGMDVGSTTVPVFLLRRSFAWPELAVPRAYPKIRWRDCWAHARKHLPHDRTR